MININGFHSFLLEKLSPNSADSYLSYLRQCTSFKLSLIPSGSSLLDLLCKKCNEVSSNDDRFNIIQNYIAELSLELSKTDSSQTKLRKDLTNVRSALRKFSDYATTYSNSPQDVQKIRSRSLSHKRDNREIDQFDGMSILTDLFPEIKQFIEFVLTSCFFFSKEDVHGRHKDIIKWINEKKAIPSRLSKNKTMYPKDKDVDRGSKRIIFNDNHNSGDILTDIDSNGNAAIDKLFTQKTRRYLKGNTSRKPDFINLKISHIWGSAYDPRYFTSLWNIVLIPSFANDILDKPSSNSGDYYIGATLLNTLKCILYNYYEFDSLNWTGIRLNKPSYIEDKVIKGKYTINVFKQISNGDDNGIPEIEPIDIII